MPLNERFVRWQSQTITQLSFSISLFTGYSVAALGFSMTLLRESSFTPKGFYAHLYLFSIAVLGLSILLGVFATVTRLLDFRATTYKIDRRRDRRKASSSEITNIDKDITEIGGRIRCLGKATWRLFWGLLITFFVGISTLAISLLSVYSSKFL